MGIFELLLVLSPAAGDTLPPPPPVPPPIECWDGIYRLTDIMPVAPGCETHPEYDEQQRCTRDTLKAFVQSNLRWPAPDWCGQGTAVVQFVIGSDGRVRDEQIIRSLGRLPDRSVLKIMERMKEDMPVWTPGRQGERAVPVMYNLPVRFELK